MNALKRAFLSVTRKLGRTIILIVILTVIANLVLTGLAIRSATVAAGVQARKNLGGTLTFQFDRQKAMAAAQAANSGGDTTGNQRGMFNIDALPVTQDMVNMIMKQNPVHISDYNITVNTGAMASGFSPVTENDTASSSTSSSATSSTSGQGFNFMGGGRNITLPDVSITGVRKTGLLDEFDNKSSVLLSGNHIVDNGTAQGIVMIEKNLADANGLKVGDYISFTATPTTTTNTSSSSTSSTTPTTTTSTHVYKCKIVGIYQATVDTSATANGTSRMASVTYTNPYNKIYMDYTSALIIKSNSATLFGSSAGIDSATFYADDPQNIDSLEANIAKLKIDWTKFTISADDTTYQAMMKPIESVASISLWVVILVAIAGAIILALILLFSAKERNYETGVLLSMGENKSKIIFQYLAETIMIAVLAFSLSIFTGGLIANNVGNALVKNQNAAYAASSSSTAQNQQNGGGRGGYGGAGGYGGRAQMLYTQRQHVEPISSLDVKIDAGAVGEMVLLGLLVIILATTLPAANIMRFKPKKILTKIS